MKRFKSILCASLLTLSISSVALGGNISGRSGNISGAPTSIAGNISGAPTSIAALVYSAILGLLIP